MATKKKPALDKKYTYRFIALMLVLLVITLGLRLVLTGDGIPADDTLWKLSIDINTRTDSSKFPIQFTTPMNTRHIRLVGENILHPGLRLKRETTEQSANREIHAIPTRVGNKQLLISYLVHMSKTPFPRTTAAAALNTEAREHYLQLESGLDEETPELVATLDKLSQGSPTQAELLARIFNYTRKNIALDTKDRSRDAFSALNSRRGNTLTRARAMVALCRASHIPARLVTGFILEDKEDTNLHFWVEIYDEKKWSAYDPQYGYEGTIPRNYLPMRWDSPDLVSTENRGTQVVYNLTQEPATTGVLGGFKKNFLSVLDLTRLSSDARTTISILLLLPLGALLTTFFRQVIGIRSYGTFTPSLLALAVLYTDPLTAAVTILIVMGISFPGRHFIPMHLTRVPRLTILYTMVAASMVLSMSIMDYYDFNPSGHTVLLPVVILTTLMDRLYSTLDENGMLIAMRRLLWTVFIAVFCFFILLQDSLRYIYVRFPELHFLTIAFALWFSMYSGKKLVEYPRFRWMCEITKKESKKEEKADEAAL